MRSAISLSNKEMTSGAIWNVIGSGLYAVVSMILGTLVIRVLGGDKGGIFFFAFSTLGQHLYVISYFGIRAIHSTDTGERFSFGEYHKLRVFTAATALLVGIVTALAYSGFSYKAAVIIIVAVYRILDGYVDVYECEMQRDGRLDMTGKSMTFRTLAVVTAFLIVMFVTRSLIASAAALTLALAFSVWAFDIRKLKRFDAAGVASGYCRLAAEKNVGEGKVRQLFDESVWLFIGVFLDFLIFASSKYAVDAELSSTLSGYYSTLFVPASVMLLFANFVVRPMLPRMSEAYAGGDRAGLKKMLLGCIAVIAAVTLIGAVAAYFMGVQVLCIFAGAEAREAMIEYRFALALIVISGGLYAMNAPLYYALVIARKQKTIFCVYLIVAAISFALAFFMVIRGGITGGTWSMVISLGILFAGFYLASARHLWR